MVQNVEQLSGIVLGRFLFQEQKWTGKHLMLGPAFQNQMDKDMYLRTATC